MKSLLYVPKFNLEVVLEYIDNKFKIEYIPKSCYTEQEIKKEVELIIERMLKEE